jgi:hypothetical protein
MKIQILKMIFYKEVYTYLTFLHGKQNINVNQEEATK